MRPTQIQARKHNSMTKGGRHDRPCMLLELMAFDCFCKRGSQFSLMVWHWVHQAHFRNGPTGREASQHKLDSGNLGIRERKSGCERKYEEVEWVWTKGRIWQELGKQDEYDQKDIEWHSQLIKYYTYMHIIIQVWGEKERKTEKETEVRKKQIKKDYSLSKFDLDLEFLFYPNRILPHGNHNAFSLALWRHCINELSFRKCEIIL